MSAQISAPRRLASSNMAKELSLTGFMDSIGSITTPTRSDFSDIGLRSALYSKQTDFA